MAARISFEYTQEKNRRIFRCSLTKNFFFEIFMTKLENFFSNKLITGLMKISFSPRSDLDYGKFKYFNDLLTSSNNWLREMEEQSNQTSFEIDYYVNTMEKWD